LEDLHKTKEQLIDEIKQLRMELSKYEQESKKGTHVKINLIHDAQNNYEEILKLILALSTNFIVLSPEDIDDGINDILKTIGLYAKADGSYVFTFSKDGNAIIKTHEWHNEGVQYQKKDSKSLKTFMVSWFINKIRELEVIHIPDVDILSPEIIKEIENLLLPEIKSLIALPLVSAYKAIGFLCLEMVNEKRIWQENIISLLKIVGELFANAIVQKQMTKALKESEQKYRSIFENIVEGIFQITLDGKLLSVNPSFAIMHGYNSPEEMLKDINKLKQIFDEPEEFSKIKRILEEKDFLKWYEIKSKKRDGSVFWTSMNVHTVRNDKDEILYFEGTLENINERKKVEETLDRERKTYSNILKNAPYGIILIDKKGNFQYVNPEFINITEYTLEEVPTGRIWFEKAFPDEDLRKDAIKTWKENINIKKGNLEKIYRIVCKNKEVKEIEFKVATTESGETVTMLLDVTERRKAEELFRTLANNSPVGVYILEKEKIKFVNNYFKNITGFSDEELIDKNPLNMVYPEDRKMIIYETYKMLKGQRKNPFEFRIITKNGEVKWILQNIVTVQYMGKNVALASFLDITDAKKIELMLKESEERYRILTERSPVGVYLIQDELFRYVNQIFSEIVNYKPEEIINKLSLKDFAEDFEGKPLDQIIKDLRDERSGIRLEISIRRKDGGRRYCEMHGSRIIYNGRPAVLGTLIDVTEKKQMEEKLKYLSITDELTGVYNRRGFFTVSEQQFKIAKRLEKNMVLFYLDLDDLKWINDNLGHKEGDNAIVAFVGILKNAFRESDIIGRLGGDEFAILALSTGFDKPQLIIKRLNNLIDKYNERDKKPYKLSFSVGFVRYNPHTNQSLEELISIADDLMYLEKKRKKMKSRPPNQFIVGIE